MPFDSIVRLFTSGTHECGCSSNFSVCPFRIDQGGAAEYECAQDEWLANMRASDLECRSVIVRINGSTRRVFLIADWRKLDDLTASLRKWIANGCRSQMPSYFLEAFSGQQSDKAPVAWWAYEEGAAWTLDRNVAATLLDVFRSEASH